MEQDDIKDLLALGGAINQQINASNSMRMEGDKSIPRLDPRKLIFDMSGRGVGTASSPLPVLPIGQNPVINDVDFQGIRVTPMAGLIPLEEAITDDMRKRGVTGRDLVANASVGTPAAPQVVRTSGNAPINPVVPVQDKNQLQFDFIERLNNPKKQTQMEYFDEKFLLLDVKLDKITEKLNILLGKKKRI